MDRIEIVCIGDELVRGITADTNGSWIAGRLAEAGMRVARITVLPDVVATIADELRAATARGARLVVTTGGLGPTEDDRTLEAIAAAADVTLEAHAWALEFVAGRYRFLAEAGVIASGALTPERRKMAVLPRGADALVNEVGTAPGVVVRIGRITFACLPGVPAEMRAMWTSAVEPLARDLLAGGGHAEATVVAECNDESVLAPLLAATAARHPGVYVKSRADEFAPGGGLRVTLVASGADEASARTALDEALGDLHAELRAAGYGMRT
jgi:molybdenum cofactor synthesis domain-containing protein